MSEKTIEPSFRTPVLGYILLFYGIANLSIIGVLFLFALAFAGLFSWEAFILLIFLLATTIPSTLAFFGLDHRKSWAKHCVIITAILAALMSGIVGYLILKSNYNEHDYYINPISFYSLVSAGLSIYFFWSAISLRRKAGSVGVRRSPN